MLTGMRMKNFKSWADTGEIRLAPLTAIFGTNSSGKSSLLQMLLLLKQTTESNDRNLVLRTGNNQDGYVNLGTAAEITHGSTTDLTMGIRWKLPNPIKISRVKEAGSPEIIEIHELDFTTLIYADTKITYVQELCYQTDNFKGVMRRATKAKEIYEIEIKLAQELAARPKGRPRSIGKPEKCYGFGDEAIRFYQDTGYLNDIVLSFEKQFSRIYYLGPLRGYPERTYNWAGERPSDVGMRGERAVSALLAGRQERVYPSKSGKNSRIQLQARIKLWLKEMGLAVDFKTNSLMQGSNQYEVRLKRTSESQEVLIPDMGFGVSQVLPVLVLCYYAPPGSTLIFEQPEIHLHPAVQSILADVFIDVMRHRNIQLIIESHSEHLLRRLQLRIAEGQEITKEQIAFYFCELENGKSKIDELEIDVFGNIRNWPRDFFGDLTGDLLNIMDISLKRESDGDS